MMQPHRDEHSGRFQDSKNGESSGADGAKSLDHLSGTPVSGRVGIVANRGSGNGSSVHLVRRLVGELGKSGHEAEVAWTPDERRSLVSEAGNGSGCRCLVAVGGDGTVSALINEQ